MDVYPPVMWFLVSRFWSIINAETMSFFAQHKWSKHLDCPVQAPVTGHGRDKGCSETQPRCSCANSTASRGAAPGDVETAGSRCAGGVTRWRRIGELCNRTLEISWDITGYWVNMDKQWISPDRRWCSLVVRYKTIKTSLTMGISTIRKHSIP